MEILNSDGKLFSKVGFKIYQECCPKELGKQRFHETFHIVLDLINPKVGQFGCSFTHPQTLKEFMHWHALECI